MHPGPVNRCAAMLGDAAAFSNASAVCDMRGGSRQSGTATTTVAIPRRDSG